MTLTHLTAEELAERLCVQADDPEHEEYCCWDTNKLCGCTCGHTDLQAFLRECASRLRGKPGWVMVPREDLIVATTLLMGLPNPPPATDRFLNALYPIAASQRAAAAGEE